MLRAHDAARDFWNPSEPARYRGIRVASSAVSSTTTRTPEVVYEQADPLIGTAVWGPQGLVATTSAPGGSPDGSQTEAIVIDTKLTTCVDSTRKCHTSNRCYGAHKHPGSLCVVSEGMAIKCRASTSHLTVRALLSLELGDPNVGTLRAANYWCHTTNTSGCGNPTFPRT